MTDSNYRVSTADSGEAVLLQCAEYQGEIGRFGIFWQSHSSLLELRTLVVGLIFPHRTSKLDPNARAMAGVFFGGETRSYTRISHANKILVVDDEPLVLRMVKIALEGGGHDVVTAPSAQDGLASCREPRDNLLLVISDIRMPG